MKTPAKPATPDVAPVKPEPKAPALPGVCSIVPVHLEGGDFPMIVTRSGEDSIDGQAFLDGTQTVSVVNATYGDGLGQIASPNSHSKEA